MKYDYEITGAAANGQTWFVAGGVETQKPGDFMDTPYMAIGKAFEALTHGKAVYGQPGAGCSGPYRVTRMLIAEKEDGTC